MTRHSRRSRTSLDEVLEEWAELTSHASRPTRSLRPRPVRSFARAAAEAALVLAVVGVVVTVLLIRPDPLFGPGSTPAASHSPIPPTASAETVGPSSNPSSHSPLPSATAPRTPLFPPPSPTHATLAGEWRKLPPAPIADGNDATGVWTGEEFIVWGTAGLSDGAAYNPTSDSWRALPKAPGGPRRHLDAVWTGQVVIAWDGGQTVRGRSVPDGGIYDPATDRWQPIPRGPLTATDGQGLAWSGRELLVLTPDMHMAAYDPSTEAWRDLPSPPLPEGFVLAKWFGDEWLVLGFGSEPGKPGALAAFNPETEEWRMLEPSPLSSTNDDADAVLALGKLFTALSEVRGYQGGLVYDLATDRWERTNSPSCGAGSPGAIWTGDLIMTQYSAFDPATGECRVLPPAPQRDFFFPTNSHDWGVVAWTGTELLVWGGSTGGDIDIAPADGAAFRPAR